jgi:hypothetical protein
MLIVLIVSFAALFVSVGLHYQLFRMLSGQLPRIRVRERWRVALGIVGAMGAHLLEIGVFAAAMGFLHQLHDSWGVGDLTGARHGSIPDYLYCSAMAYTTLGFEQITPVGAMRLLIGIEALAGLVLVAWSASFTYLQMSRYWEGPPHGK